MTDRFTQAFSELTERNPYICESCGTTFGHPTITHLPDNTGQTGRHKKPDTLSSLEFDAMPFGD